MSIAKEWDNLAYFSISLIWMSCEWAKSANQKLKTKEKKRWKHIGHKLKWKHKLTWAPHLHRQIHKAAHKKLNVYFYSLGTHLSLHECITRHIDRASQYVSECVCSWRSENNVTPKGSHLSPFSPSSLIRSSLLCACRDFPFQFRRDVRPVPPSLTQRLDSALFSPNIFKTHQNQPHFKISGPREA